MSYAALNKYKENSVSSATPEELTLMLYDGAIKFMNIAKFSIEKKEMEKAHHSLVRAQDIINELNYSLDMKYEISGEMRDLYDFILTNLVDGNLQKNIKPIDDALSITTEMRDTWKEVIKAVKQKIYRAK